MSSRHQVDWLVAEKALRDNPIRQELVGSHGEGSNKSIYVIVKFGGNEAFAEVQFQVTDHREVVLVTRDVRAAVDRYNEAP